jgi:stage II sporulation protein D
MTSTLNRHLRMLPMGHLSWLTLLCWLLWIAPAVARDLRIAVQQGQSQIPVGSSTPAQILDGTGKPLGQLPALRGYFATSTGDAINLADQKAWTITVKPTNGGFVYIGKQWYRGTVSLVNTSKGVMAVNNVNLEDYLTSVVGKEAYASWPQEVLKAQAVAARSFALYRVQKQTNPLFDLGDNQTYQVYAGLDGEADSTHRAVQATQGKVLTYSGNIIEAVFHANAGGHTENSENVWGGVTPYLRGITSPDQAGRNFQWNEQFTAGDLRQKLPGLGNIQAIKPLAKTPTGRIAKVEILGDKGRKTMTGRDLRQALKLKSTLFEVIPPGLVASQSGSAAPSGFQFNGKGHGHGLGMSQWGAFAMAEEGKTYQQILQHYYKGTVLSQIN